MPRKAKPTPDTDDIQRIRVRADGYDASGAYWGAGDDVFIFSSAAQDITVRAKSLTEARAKIDAERTRPPGQTTPREKLGGTPPSKIRYEIQWSDPVTNGAAITIRITHSRDYLGQGQDHVEVESIKPPKVPLPITSTGYISHFIAPLPLMNAGGPVTFVTAWLQREANAPAWRKAQLGRAQGDLFQWAEAQAGTTHRTPRRAAAAAAKPTATALRRSRKEPRQS